MSGDWLYSQSRGNRLLAQADLAGPARARPPYGPRPRAHYHSRAMATAHPACLDGAAIPAADAGRLRGDGEPGPVSCALAERLRARTLADLG